MVNLTINSVEISVPEGTTILEAARTAHIHIPHLCYLKEINEIGACRLCCVEVEGEEKLIPACSNVVKEGMKIVTNSTRVRTASRINLELIMSQHDCKCAVCVRNGSCQLQKLADEFNLIGEVFDEDVPCGKQTEWNEDFPLIKNAKKCVKCMRCIQVCDKVQSLGVWDVVGTGSRTHVDVANIHHIEEASCSLCGQCITHCPVGALHERDDCAKVMDAINDPDVTTVVQIAPAVRAAWGEEMGLAKDEASVKLLAGALRELGFDYVFDTSFSADLTIMEEGNEFIERLTKGDLEKYPMFTSCCPGWVRFLKSQYPELTGQLSTAKSPQQMFGSMVKNYFAKKIDAEPRKIFSVSIMPCVAKKQEADLPTMKTNGIKDVDAVLTTREVTRMIQAERISLNGVEECEYDNILGDMTGAAIIFGTTGGVMEAALRSAYNFITGENPDADAFKVVPSENEAWIEKELTINDITVRIAVTSGLGNARKLCDEIVSGRKKFDFVEVMACPGGCAGGGGQIIHTDDIERAKERGEHLRELDKKMTIRFSHENKDVQALYVDFLGKPLGEKSEKYLHTDHFGWNM